MTRPTVGYYVHHQGRGHLHRALALGRRLGERGVDVVFLSSLAGPDAQDAQDDPDDPVQTDGAAGPRTGWLRLPHDADAADGLPVDVAPGGLLHWAPRRHAGLRQRMARISAWIETARPDLLVSDVSQEVSLLARLHGVPVLSVVLPGDRGDAPHLLGLGVSDRLVGFWPPSATRMVTGLPPEVSRTLVAVGAMSRFTPDHVPAVHVSARRSPGGSGAGRRLLVLAGRGGDAWSADELARLCSRAQGWQVEALGPQRWVDDPWPHLRAADVVLTRAGQVSVAEVAAARRPAVVVAAQRPHDEQAHTAAQLADSTWPALVRPGLDAVSAADLDVAAGFDGARWSSWCDGLAADRFADVVLGLVDPPCGATGPGRPGDAHVPRAEAGPVHRADAICAG